MGTVFKDALEKTHRRPERQRNTWLVHLGLGNGNDLGNGLGMFRYVQVCLGNDFQVTTNISKKFQRQKAPITAFGKFWEIAGSFDRCPAASKVAVIVLRLSLNQTSRFTCLQPNPNKSTQRVRGEDGRMDTPASHNSLVHGT